ncbi:MAG: hypothetical protein U0559_18450 [Anaerolineae bacterium]
MDPHDYFVINLAGAGSVTNVNQAYSRMAKKPIGQFVQSPAKLHLLISVLLAHHSP